MPFFRIAEYTDKGDVMLIRFKVMEKAGGGLPPMSSQTIMFNNEELNELIKVLQDYANERRDS